MLAFAVLVSAAAIVLAFAVLVSAAARVLDATMITAEAFVVGVVVGVLNFRRQRRLALVFGSAAAMRRFKAGGQLGACRHVGRVASLAIAHRRRSPGRQQHRDNIVVAVGRRHMQGRAPVGIERIEVGTGGDEQLDEGSVGLNPHLRQLGRQIDFILQEHGGGVVQLGDIARHHELVEKSLHRLVELLGIEVFRHAAQFTQADHRTRLVLHRHTVPL